MVELTVGETATLDEGITVEFDFNADSKSDLA